MVVKRSNRLLILLGLLIAISAAVAAAAYVSSGTGGTPDNAAVESPTPTAEPQVQVVATQVAIPAGTTITAPMLKLETMTLSARDALGSDTFSSVAQVVGKIAGADIAANQVIVASNDFYAAGSVMEGKSLKDSIAAGMVAVSMEVDQVNGVGTLVVPGDHVDVILSVYVDQIAAALKDTNGDTVTFGGSQLTAKMIFENCRVLATLLPPAGAAPTSGATPNPSGEVPTEQPSSPVVQNTDRHEIVIIEVYPDQAEVIRWAQRSEKIDPQNYIDLGLALRSSKDDGADIATNPGLGKPYGITFATLVAVYGVLPPDPTSTLPKVLADKIKW
jgi:pilus assembly protein CpaB